MILPVAMMETRLRSAKYQKSVQKSKHKSKLISKQKSKLISKQKSKLISKQKSQPIFKHSKQKSVGTLDRPDPETFYFWPELSTPDYSLNKDNGKHADPLSNNEDFQDKTEKEAPIIVTDDDDEKPFDVGMSDNANEGIPLVLEHVISLPNRDFRLNNGIDFQINPEKGATDDDDERPLNMGITNNANEGLPLILKLMKSLTNTEKYLLYLKLSQDVNVVDPLRQPLNPKGTRLEVDKAILWMKTHLEEDPQISLPKEQVYTDYSNYCLQNHIKPLYQADFGKVMRKVFPKVRPRRLGTRGHSRYCYSGLRRCVKLKTPTLPDLADKPRFTEAAKEWGLLDAVEGEGIKHSETQVNIQEKKQPKNQRKKKLQVTAINNTT